MASAWGGNRTRTATKDRGILSPLRLPIPPPRHLNQDKEIITEEKSSKQ
jgi:hypothetical protein